MHLVDVVVTKSRSIFGEFGVEFDKRRSTLSEIIILTTVGSSSVIILIDISKMVYDIKMS